MDKTAPENTSQKRTKWERPTGAGPLIGWRALDDDADDDVLDVPSLDSRYNTKKVDNDDYNVFTMEKEHPGQLESINDTYLVDVQCGYT
ncbi:hypothetical protein Tco_0951174 [Tanacetum coccineum]|uniref:Uncharacterized protein n=1 Tax=Tanacetum coccineum TaxID=301880 RepID=A0ABQ5E024_9ASTR